MTLILTIVNQFLCMAHRLVIIHHHAKFGKKMVERCRRYQVNMIGHTDRQTKLFQYNPPPPMGGGGRGVNIKKNYYKGTEENPYISISKYVQCFTYPGEQLTECYTFTCKKYLQDGYYTCWQRIRRDHRKLCVQRIIWNVWTLHLKTTKQCHHRQWNVVILL